MTPWRLVLGGVAVAVGVTGLVWSTIADDGGRDEPAAVDGATTFRLRGCASCHDGPGSDSTFDAGPPLLGAAAWAGTRRPGVDATAYLTESMRSPAAFVASGDGSTSMPTLALTDAEIDALVAYLLAG